MSLATSLAAIESRISAACSTAQRSREGVMLLAVSKTQPVGALAEAAALGLRAFGENYVQEALPKIAQLAGLGIDWHHIGPIQSNKTADIAQHFAWAHGIDRLKIAQRLSDQRPAHLSPLNVCVQVNVSGEASKSGCPPQDAVALCRKVALLPRLRLRGLMALPAPITADSDERTPFRTMHALFAVLRADCPEVDTLSMGMSDDFEAAIAEGSTLIRVGTALFGRRSAGKTSTEPAS